MYEFDFIDFLNKFSPGTHLTLIYGVSGIELDTSRFIAVIRSDNRQSQSIWKETVKC